MKKRKRRSRSRSLSRYDSFSDLAGLDEATTPQNVASWGAIGLGTITTFKGMRRLYSHILDENEVEKGFLEAMAGMATATAGVVANKSRPIANYGRVMVYGMVANTAIFLTGGFEPDGWLYKLLTGKK